jgi:asparagine synthase (glutamine-hydrolysing)
MAYRGPDAQEIHVDGSVGLGHALMHTGGDSHERQPFTLDGRTWITADARIDARAELMADLGIQDSQARQTIRDEELILRAYAKWGEDCLQHLMGDFAFGIWDGPRKRLFCGRDHFGVKPFYYARVGQCLIFSNTLNCIRLYPDVSAELNDQAIGDFLLFNFNQDPRTTAFRDIQRLPPAHHLTRSDRELRLKRYWTLPTDECIRYRRSSDYVDRFKELLRAAVSDRLRIDRVGVLMSGGLDSTTIAATSKEILAHRSTPFDLRAFTIVFDRLLPDKERHFSSVAAAALGMPIHQLTGDDYRPYERCTERKSLPPEPAHEPFAAMWIDHLRQVATHSPTALTGYGPDCMLAYPMRAHIARCLRQVRLDRVVTALAQYAFAHGRFCHHAVTSSLKRCVQRHLQQSIYPHWLEPDFAKRCDLPRRWQESLDDLRPVHPTRQRAYRELTGPFWTWMFESYDAGVTGIAIDARHPFFDLRLVEFFLAIPPVPWCLNKRLLRIATRGILPESIRRRPKAPLDGDSLVQAVRRNGALLKDEIIPAPALFKYVAVDELPRITGKEGSDELWSRTLPMSLNVWLQHLTAIPTNAISGTACEEVHQ